MLEKDHKMMTGKENMKNTSRAKKKMGEVEFMDFEDSSKKSIHDQSNFLKNNNNLAQNARLYFCVVDWSVRELEDEWLGCEGEATIFAWKYSDIRAEA